jgi:ligand-binding SRPBCC domain-containing protein
MAIRQLVHHQLLAASIEEVWSFFSDARNLATITPEYMNFRVTSGDLPSDIYPGQIITYKVSPMFGIPMFWMTEITAVKKYRLFVDEQRRGPYRLWHHQHLFQEVENGVEMTDIVHYELPLGPLGNLANAMFVRKQLQSIFEYRTAVIVRKFGTSLPVGKGV